MSLAPGRASVAVCQRCCFKFKYQELVEDGNIKGYRVCKTCRDPKNPWRLPPIKPDAIALKYPRPDTPLYPFAVQEPPIPPTPPVPGRAVWGDPTAIWGAELRWGAGTPTAVWGNPAHQWGDGSIWGTV